METSSAFARGEAARTRGAELMVFDWEKAARLIKERGAHDASAGLSGDWEWTGGSIYKDGHPDLEDYTFLASIWAEPEIVIDGEVMECWRYEKETPGWDSSTKWPQEALDILYQQ